MLRDEVFARPGVGSSDFNFSREVSEVFEDMLDRSVPFYREIVRMVAEMAKTFYLPGSVLYDLGSSTGNVLEAFSHVMGDRPFEYAGIDNSPAMIEKSLGRDFGLKDGQSARFLEKDILDCHYSDASVIFAGFTFQFVRPMSRTPLVEKLFDALKPGGVLIFAEKVLEEDSLFSRLFVEYYYDFKRRNGYSDLEISQKRESLENVLIPYRLDENRELLQKAGFSRQSVFIKWYNFSGMVAIKEHG